MPASPDSQSRRDFLKTSSAAAIGGSLLANFAATSGLYAGVDETLRVGLVGCGGRGTGAAINALGGDPNAKLVALADAFGPESEAAGTHSDELSRCVNNLKNASEVASQVEIEPDLMFEGLGAYRQLIDNVDVVLLCTPPGFRPEQLRYAVEQGKHVFTEKPMATDAVGCRSVMESVRLSKEKGLAVVAGFCWRYDYAKRAFFSKLHEGAIGNMHTAFGTYLTSPVKPMPPATDRPAGMSDLQWMVANWYNFTWLSGDGLVEQACHTVDWLAWAFGDKPPVSCTAVGGRQIPAEGGNIFDHIEVNYVWEDGRRAFISQRQIPNCYGENNLYVLGSEGAGQILPRGVSFSGKETWTYDGETPNMYQVEHNEFFASIRNGEPINDGDRMINSTQMAIMGRMAGYTGKEVTWEHMLSSEENLTPMHYENWDTPVEFPEVALPGITPLV